MSRLEKMFTEHPASVGETYGEHFQMAMGFSVAMILGGLACLVHAVLPFAFEKTGSGIITRLYDRMVTNRSRLKARQEASLPQAAAGAD